MINLRGLRPMFFFTKTKTPSIPRKVSQIFTSPKKEETYERRLDITMRNGGEERWSVPTHGVAMFDTQCEHNLVTTKFLKEIGFEWQPSTDNTQITQMNNTNIKCLGEVQGRWYPIGAPKRPWYLAGVPKRLLKGLNFRPRYEICTFKIVDLQTFDLIIGRTTINDLGLLQTNRSFFGAFRPVPIRVDCKFAKLALWTLDC